MPDRGYGHMVLDDLVTRVRAMRKERTARLASVNTRSEAEAYALHAKAAIRQAFVLPERTPLNVQHIETITPDTMRIEKLTFESRPGFVVTANLYLPASLQDRAPAVLCPCGHADPGKGYVLYQQICQRLTQAGFVVLTYDPINQGERDQYALLDDRECVRGSVAAHNMMGKQLGLLTESFAAWRAWDGIRALDVLLERPEVDPTHVGITGNSGGGTMTTWLWPLDDRLTMAAPSCYVTSFQRNIENEEPQDAEQYPPGILGAGLDMADFLLARSPSPLLLMGQNYDFFDRRGLREAHGECERLYDVLGADPGDLGLFIDAQGHGFSRANQIAATAFFARHAGLPDPDPTFEPKPLDPEALLCTPSGQVVHHGSRPIPALIADRGRQVRDQRPVLAAEEVGDAVASFLCLPSLPERPYFRALRPLQVNDTLWARLAIETEGSIRAILKRITDYEGHPFTLDPPTCLTLYLPHAGCEQDTAIMRGLAENGPVYGLDVRGLGESMPDDPRGFWHNYGLDYMAQGVESLLGGSMLAKRVYDLLVTLRLLRQEGAQQIRLWGRGQGAILVLVAGLLDPEVEHITAQNGPTAMQDWVETPLVAWPAANMPRSMLQQFDLPDIVTALGERVTVIDPWDEGMGA